MKKLIGTIIILALFLILPKSALGVENPLSVPNNIFGVHILFPSEINDVSSLINTNGGDWGYVTIPIQAGDKDLVKWQNFMDAARANHIIPIIRLATEGDYFNTKVWRKPTAEDVLDFANFLNSLNWPTKNRYIIVFNEVNRADEWGGSVNPAEYADLLAYAETVFKNRSSDFFIISAGLDNAATNSTDSTNEYDFIRQIYADVPDALNNLDGMASHSYPNPGFSQAPSITSKTGVASFKFERDEIKQLTNRDLPVFITETGWSNNSVLETTQASYYLQTFSNVWNDPGIVAITPFLLRADTPPFKQFSLLNNGSPDIAYKTLTSFVKTKGQPDLNPVVKQDDIRVLGISQEKNFLRESYKQKLVSLPNSIKTLFKWLLKI